MTTKIAVLVIHGIGNQTKNFYTTIQGNLQKHFAKVLGDAVENPAAELVVEPAWWAPVLQRQDTEFENRIKKGGRVGFPNLRTFILNTAADAVAYQPIPGNRVLYDEIHLVVAQTLNTLAQKAGPDAPLCVVAHSLGTIVVSNYLWDLQHHIPQVKELIGAQVVENIENTPLEKGETLAHLYTLGSPLALWSLRWSAYEYGTPILFPAPQLEQHHPGVQAEWINFYDKDDVIGYPLRGLNEQYAAAVIEDREVNVGN